MTGRPLKRILRPSVTTDMVPLSEKPFVMSSAAEVINLDEFRKRRESRPSSIRSPAPMSLWTPVWVWVMVWPT